MSVPLLDLESLATLVYGELSEARQQTVVSAIGQFVARQVPAGSRR